MFFAPCRDVAVRRRFKAPLIIAAVHWASSPGRPVQHSLSKTLTVITGLLVVVLVSVFAVIAKSAFDRQRDADRILSVVTVKRDMISSLQALRLEGGALDLAMEQTEPASPAFQKEIMALHARTDKSIAHLHQHNSNHFSAGYDEILARVCSL